MRALTILAAATAACVLAACGPAPAESIKATSDVPLVKKCPDVNNRDTNDPCSPLYFKKKGSKLPDATDFK